jgi:hypothetical protein
MMEQAYCEKCHTTMSINNFYKLKDGTPAKLCKKCLTMHIDNFDPETFLWVLELLDLPYVPVEWNKIRDKAFVEFQKNPKKIINGMTVLGKYISLMKLKQWKGYGWADTEKIQNLQKERTEAYIEAHPEVEQQEQELKEKYEAGLISEAQYKTLISTETQKEELESNPSYLEALMNSANGGMYGVPQDQQFIQEDELPNPAEELTQEDKVYLAMKWGRYWQPNEWITLEQTYNEYMESFDVQDADTRNNILLICQTYLKMTQALQSGDYSSYTSLNRTYESLRKTAKLTAAQNKEAKENFVDCIGNMVVLCEKEGFIPRYDTSSAQDKIDKALQDMNNFTQTFAKQNLGLSQQIEMYLKRIEIQNQKNQEDDEKEYSSEDFVEYYDSIEQESALDEAIQEGEFL